MKKLVLLILSVTFLFVSCTKKEEAVQENAVSTPPPTPVPMVEKAQEVKEQKKEAVAPEQNKEADSKIQTRSGKAQSPTVNTNKIKGIGKIKRASKLPTLKKMNLKPMKPKK